VHPHHHVIRVQAPQHWQERLHQHRARRERREGLALERHLAAREVGRARGWAALQRQHIRRPEVLPLVGELERLLPLEHQPDPRRLLRAHPLEQPARLVEPHVGTVGEADRAHAASRESRRWRHAPPRDRVNLFVYASLLQPPPGVRLPRAPVPVDAAVAREVAARVEVARPVAWRARLAVFVSADPEERGSLEGEPEAEQAQPADARVPQPLPAEGGAVQHQHALEVGVQRRLPGHQALRALALGVEGGHLPLDRARGRKLLLDLAGRWHRERRRWRAYRRSSFLMMAARTR